MSAREEFATYLELSGSRDARRRLAGGDAAWARMRARWSGEIIARGVTRAAIEQRLGPPDFVRDAALGYRLPTRPGYAYVIRLDVHGRWCGSAFERMAARPQFPDVPSCVADWRDFVVRLAELGTTEAELLELAGEPRVREGWWPVETWTYQWGMLELRHGIVDIGE